MIDIDFYTKVDKELAKIPYCSSKCDYYSVCPVCDRSGSELAACSLRMLPEDKRRRFVNLYIRGRDGLQAETTELLFNLATNLDLRKNPADMITYIDTILKIDRAFKIPAVGRSAGPKMEAEDYIPEVIDVTVSQKAKKPDPNEKIVRKIERQLDENKESLYNSPIVDQICAGVGKIKASQIKMLASAGAGGALEP